MSFTAQMVSVKIALAKLISLIFSKLNEAGFIMFASSYYRPSKCPRISLQPFFNKLAQGRIGDVGKCAAVTFSAHNVGAR